MYFFHLKKFDSNSTILFRQSSAWKDPFHILPIFKEIKRIELSS